VLGLCLVYAQDTIRTDGTKRSVRLFVRLFVCSFVLRTAGYGLQTTEGYSHWVQREAYRGTMEYNGHIYS